MEMAKGMLADSSIPIGEVGNLCGYPNPKYFSVVFKKMFGMSPAAYRQSCLS
jgi:two-component system response regulator YesN